ncbi:hypothetical protein ACROYT_G013227 [Oculina patagonica]
MAVKRLESTKRKLKRDEDLAKKYCAIIEDYVDKGYARKLSPEEAAVPTPKQWFLPHHPVRNPNKPDKVRIVMDAAAKHDGVEQRVGLAADIEAMFHQVQIIEEDRPALRFLWWNLELQRPPDVYQMLVMIFGAASSPCTANFVLRKRALDNREDVLFSEDTIKSVEKNFYMDDFLKSMYEPTKRGVLSRVSTLFNPLGLLAPYMLPAKCLKSKGWDEPLDEQDRRIWEDWLGDLVKLSEFELPRCFSVDTCPEASIQLHVFAEASEMGFGAVLR